jgi:hypothetical protein
MALRARDGEAATFIDPVLLEGSEGARNWERAILTIPSAVQARIAAIVVDNLRGVDVLARRHAWALQLCQFHMLLKLQVRRRGPRRALKGGKIRSEIYGLIRHALECPDDPDLRRLHMLVKTSCGTNRIRAMVREFLACIEFYRTYRQRPELHLPTTTNAVESMGSRIRDLLRRNRCASSPRALHAWATAFTRLNSNVLCNGKNLNRLS